MTYSSGIIKPDGVARNLQSEIFKWFKTAGLSTVFQKTLELTPTDVEILYGYCRNAEHYPSLKEFLCSGPAVFYVVAVPQDAIESLNRLVGSTDPATALRETIRGKFGENIQRNVIHSTQNPTTLKQDLVHFLTREEMLTIFL